jgi:uncharacterized protein
MNMSKQLPIDEQERLPWIDCARGFALFGILMVNVPAFNAPFFLYNGGELVWNREIDKVIQTIIDIFFQASFYTLFSLLFGFGLEMMRQRMLEKKLNYQPILWRRHTGLFFIGLFHAFFLWHGDILLSYAIIGLLLFFFYHRSTKTITIFFFLALLIPTFYLTNHLYSVKEYIGWPNLQGILANMENYKSNSVLDIWKQNYEDWLYSNGKDAFIYLTILLLPMFLAGVLFMKKKWLHHVKEHERFLKIVLLVSFIVFMIGKAGPYFFGNPGWLNFFQDQIGGAASSIFYLILITLLFQHVQTKKVLNIFTYVGRMSLTNYIIQSIICFILFYGPGLNLYGTVSPLTSVFICISIYIVQVVYSKWWLHYFRFGPLEWLLRSFTYLNKQPLKK